jgi:predicted enzyme related to lactoylglutathione lyase
MPMSSESNHVATVTAELDRVVAFYRTVVDARISLEMAATEDHPRTVMLDRRRQRSQRDRAASRHDCRGPHQARRPRSDHYGIAVAIRADLTEVRDRLIVAGAVVGEIERLGDSCSLFFRDPDGTELEVCAPI